LDGSLGFEPRSVVIALADGLCDLGGTGRHGMLSTLVIHSSCAEIWQWAIKRKDSIKIIKALY
jgi:hypothetical protein